MIRALATLGLLSLAAAACPLSVAAAPRAPQAPAAAHRYIVTTNSVANAKSAATTVRVDGGRINNTYSRVVIGFSATMTADQARSLGRSRQVTSVSPDVVMRASALPALGAPPLTRTAVSRSTVQTNAPWNLDRIDQRPTALNGFYRYDTTGAGVTTFVVDTGIRRDHAQFGGRVSSGYDFVDGDSDASDCAGHGTHVAGTVGGSGFGVAKRVSSVALRVLDCAGEGYTSDIIAALDWMVSHKPSGPAIVNLSLGGAVSQPLDEAVERTVRAGVSVVVAAGNEGEDACLSSPARAASAITVAATDSAGVRPWWSNYGACVDIFAPGVRIASASSASRTAIEVQDGTSMAAPHVSGTLARYLQGHPRSTPAQATAALLAAATPMAVTKTDGSPNRLLYAPVR